MHFLQTKTGALLGVLLLGWALTVGVAGVRVHLVTHPPRDRADVIDFDSMRLRVLKVRFPAVDGPSLAGWLLEGDAAQPPILLCHDLGTSKTSMVGLAMRLNGEGFPVLLFDFRGHGESEGGPSTLGLSEKRDILGAVDFLAGRRQSDLPRIGIYGVGMGAHAAVLAAADRRALRVLVLDGLYPDAGYSLSRRVFAGWDPAVRHLGFLPRSLFGLMRQTRIADHRAAEAVTELLGRDVLLLAPAGDPGLTREMQRMYERIPAQRDVDGNLVILPATQSHGLYGENVPRHHERVAEFFAERLGRRRG